MRRADGTQRVVIHVAKRAQVKNAEAVRVGEALDTATTVQAVRVLQTPWLIASCRASFIAFGRSKRPLAALYK